MRIGDHADRACKLARVGHREIDCAGSDAPRPSLDPPREPDGGLRPPRDLDPLPREEAGDAETERLPNRLLAREPGGVMLGGIGPSVAVGLLSGCEAAISKALVPLERIPDALDLDHVGAYSRHSDSSSQKGRSATDESTTSGATADRSSSSGRNLPVRTSAVRRPKRCAPRTSDSRSSPTIQVSSGAASRASSAVAK